MEKCEKCRRKFPDHLIGPIDYTIGGHAGRLKVCPLCALKIKNGIHKLSPDESFHGEMARAMYDEALEFLKGKGVNHG